MWYVLLCTLCYVFMLCTTSISFRFLHWCSLIDFRIEMIWFFINQFDFFKDSLNELDIKLNTKKTNSFFFLNSGSQSGKSGPLSPTDGSGTPDSNRKQRNYFNHGTISKAMNTLRQSASRKSVSLWEATTKERNNPAINLTVIGNFVVRLFQHFYKILREICAIISDRYWPFVMHRHSMNRFIWFY